MGRPHFLPFLVLLLSTMPQGGLGRKIHVMRHYETWESPETMQQEDSGGLTGRRMIIAVDMDYKEPGPNPDTRNGGLFDPSASPGPSPPTLH